MISRPLPALPVLVLCGLLAACGADVSAERSATAETAGATALRIDGDAGRIEVVGEAGRTAVAAAGTAYASSQARVDAIQFVLSPGRAGGEMVLEAKAPGNNSRFDIIVRVPAGMMVAVETGTGNITIRDVAGANVSAGTGDIDIDDVTGAVVVGPIGTGHIDVREVGGTVDILDIGTGNIELAAVNGRVAIGTPNSVRVCSISMV